MVLTHEGVERAQADLSDEEFVRQAQVDPDQFGELYARCAGSIHAFAFILPLVDRNQAVAHDLTSQAFSRAFSALRSFQPGLLRAPLYSIARNAVIDHYRRQRVTAPLDAATELVVDEPGPGELAVAEDARRRLHAAFARLIPMQRQFVGLWLLELTGVEIAARLPSSSSATLICRSAWSTHR